MNDPKPRTRQKQPRREFRNELKIGEFAEQTGVSVRTLHHYDEIDLLKPAARSRSGHRLYGTAEVARMYQIRAFQSIGLPLDEIRETLDGTTTWATFEKTLVRQRAHLDSRMRADAATAQRIDTVVEQMKGRPPTLSEVGALLLRLELFRAYYTPEQLATLAERRRTIGPDRIREVEEEWPRLVSEVREAMDSEQDPGAEPVLALARRWRALVAEFTGGDREIERSAATFVREQGAHHHSIGLDAEVMKYIGQAISRLNETART